MLKNDWSDKLKEAKIVCDLHHQRMMSAHNHLDTLFPLDENKYSNLTEEQISFTDQLIYRFAKLQDTMGNKLFRLLLDGLGEETNGVAFIDILLKLEKLKLLKDHNDWLLMRETRNLVSHEYPYNKEDIIGGLNNLTDQVQYLSGIWGQLKHFIHSRFKI